MLNKKELVFVKIQNTYKLANKIRVIYRLFYKIFGLLFKIDFLFGKLICCCLNFSDKKISSDHFYVFFRSITMLTVSLQFSFREGNRLFIWISLMLDPSKIQTAPKNKLIIMRWSQKLQQLKMIFCNPYLIMIYIVCRNCRMCFWQCFFYLLCIKQSI